MAAAIALADAEGLAAVSIRRVAAELGARTMTLYSYIERKEDLLDLMADEVAAEVLVEEPLPASWREAMLTIARREREMVRRHPWRVDLVTQRSPPAPTACATSSSRWPRSTGWASTSWPKWRILAAIDDYSLGFTVRESIERAAPRRDGVTDTERAAIAEPVHARAGRERRRSPARPAHRGRRGGRRRQLRARPQLGAGRNRGRPARAVAFSR